jgi:hypothetical protein
MDQRPVELDQKYCPVTLVGSDLQTLDIFACRLARKHIAKQLVEPDHHMLQTEERLILSIKEKLSDAAHGLVACGHSLKSVVLAMHWRVLRMAKDRIQEIGVEEDLAAEAMASISVEANAILASLLGLKRLDVDQSALYFEESLS